MMASSKSKNPQACRPKAFDRRWPTADRDLVPRSELVRLDLFGLVRAHAHKVAALNLVRVPLNSMNALAIRHAP